jgi:hypothetical protein
MRSYVDSKPLTKKVLASAVALLDATKVSGRQPKGYRIGASQHQKPQHTRHCCRITSFIMYGMNQAYNVPDPSAQVPNHLVSAINALCDLQQLTV